MMMIKYMLIYFIIYSSDASLNEVNAKILMSLRPFSPVAYPGAVSPIGGCPLCDSSVYSYCSDRMIHDGCCCNAGNVPFRCPPDDCSYLNANSCYEHSVLFVCCCNNPYN